MQRLLLISVLSLLGLNFPAFSQTMEDSFVVIYPIQLPDDSTYIDVRLKRREAPFPDSILLIITSPDTLMGSHNIQVYSGSHYLGRTNKRGALQIPSQTASVSIRDYRYTANTCFLPVAPEGYYIAEIILVPGISRKMIRPRIYSKRSLDSKELDSLQKALLQKNQQEHPLVKNHTCIVLFEL